MLWCPHCLMWSARTPCRHCSSRKAAGSAPRFLGVRPSSTPEARHLWVVLLAGGEGRDFGDFSIRMFGNAIPKHFWSLDGTGGMTGWALTRATRIVPRERTIAITRSDHARWAALRFRDLPRENVLVEPADRGSAPGVLLALMKITQIDPEAVVVLLPCDHHVEEERTLSETIFEAASVAATRPERILLLGAVPDSRGPDCTWILPKGSRPSRRGSADVACILSHADLPAAEQLARDAYVSTGIVVAAGTALVAQFAATVPDLVRESIKWMIEPRDEGEALKGFYASLEPRDFTREVLNASPQALTTFLVPPCGWTDLGTPARLREFLRDRVISCPTIVPPASSEPARQFASRSH